MDEDERGPLSIGWKEHGRGRERTIVNRLKTAWTKTKEDHCQSAEKSMDEDERGPLSIRRTLEAFQWQRRGNFWETGWSAYGLFRAHRYHLQLNWTERSMVPLSLLPFCALFRRPFVGCYDFYRQSTELFTIKIADKIAVSHAWCTVLSVKLAPNTDYSQCGQCIKQYLLLFMFMRCTMTSRRLSVGTWIPWSCLSLTWSLNSN